MTIIFRKVLPLVACLTCFFMGTAKADVYTFIQNGFDDGGTITGTFTGNDLDNDGQIVYFQGSINEITGISASYSGGSSVSSLIFDLLSLTGLVYNVGTQYLGDDVNGLMEGISFVDFSGNLYLSGMGPLSMLGGLLSDAVNGGAMASSANLIEITSVVPENQNNVPLPSSIALLVFAAWLSNRQRVTKLN